MLVLTAYSLSQLIIKNSRFIAEVFPVKTPQEARDVLKRQKQTHLDASHVVHAFVIGLQSETLGCSDDGEPSGTAGRPILDVIRGLGLTNILLTVTRYFGGTLLGTGGLARAYAESAKAVLATAAIEQYIPKVSIDFCVSYPLYDQVTQVLSRYSAQIDNEEFTSNIRIQAQVPASNSKELARDLKNISAGRILLT